ncbi:MAG: RNA polymerase sigma factor [Planctomycetota bacterium]
MAPDREAPDDAALMRLFQAGDTGAFDALVRRHLAFVVRHAARYVRDESAAEDIAQEVFLRLYSSRDLFRDESNFLGWLATIASRLALNELRTRRRKHWRSRSSVGDDAGHAWLPGGEAAPPEAETLREEEIAAVRAAMERLPQKQREALWLQRFEGWDLEAVGVALELSVPAVKSLLFRARSALATELEGFLEGRPSAPQGRAS